MASPAGAASPVILKGAGHPEIQSSRCSDCGDVFIEVNEEE